MEESHHRSIRAGHPPKTGSPDGLQARLEPTEAGGNLLGTSMPLVRGRINHLAERLERLEILPKVTPVVEELRAAGMGAPPRR